MKRVFTFVLSLALVFVIPFSAIAGGLPEGTTDSTPAETISNLNEGAATKALGSVPTAGRTYNLHSGASSNSYLNVWGGIDADGTRVDMWAKDGSTEQKFKLVNGSVSGTFRLQAVCSASNRVVDAYSPSRPIQSGAGVDIWLPNDAPAQNLSIINVGVNSYKIVLSSYSTLALTAVSTANDGAVKFNTYTGASNQIWYFEEVGGSSGGTSYGDMGWRFPLSGSYSVSQTWSASHCGVDLAAASGTPVYNVANGTAYTVYATLDYGKSWTPTGCPYCSDTAYPNYGYGYCLVNETNNTDPYTGNKLKVIYEHLYERPKFSNGTNIAEGATLSKGAQIGKVGNTGHSHGNHLHFEVVKAGGWIGASASNTVNPALFYPSILNTSLSVQTYNTAIIPNNLVKDKDYFNKYVVDVSLIDYVGEGNFREWVHTSLHSGKELTLHNMLENFSITSLQFQRIVSQSKIGNAYDTAYIQSDYKTASKN